MSKPELENMKYVFVRKYMEANKLIRSMTGFGQGEARNSQYSVRVELKSVNHRYLDLFLRLPKQYNLLEEPLRALISDKIARGRVEVAVFVEEFGHQERSVQINTPLLQAYYQALEEVKTQIGSSEGITISQILTLPDVLSVEEQEADWESLENLLKEAASDALDLLVAMRSSEGARLFTDISEKLEFVAKQAEAVSAIAPEVVLDYRNRLQERLADLVDGTTITEERFLGEVAIFADRCSIDEELVRLNSHIQQLKESLHSQQPIGRKLDFLIQEMNREVNTMGSKGNNLQIASLVVDLKSELEKIREQVQNIE